MTASNCFHNWITEAVAVQIVILSFFFFMQLWPLFVVVVSNSTDPWFVWWPWELNALQLQKTHSNRKGTSKSRKNVFPASSYSSTLGLTNHTKFEPLQSLSLRVLLLKTALLLALASVKRVGELQALSVNPACLEFGHKDSKVVLKPRLGYVPKVLSTPFRAQVMTLSAFLPPTGSQ